MEGKYYDNILQWEKENRFVIGTEVIITNENTMFKGFTGTVTNAVEKQEGLYCLIKFSEAFPSCWIKSTNLITQKEFIEHKEYYNI